MDLTYLNRVRTSPCMSATALQNAPSVGNWRPATFLLKEGLTKWQGEARSVPEFPAVVPHDDHGHSGFSELRMVNSWFCWIEVSVCLSCATRKKTRWCIMPAVILRFIAAPIPFYEQISVWPWHNMFSLFSVEIDGQKSWCHKAHESPTTQHPWKESG